MNKRTTSGGSPLSTYEVFGAVAGTIAIVAYLPYIWGIVREGNKPSRATWFALSLNGWILLPSYLGAGATAHEAWLAWATAIGPTIIFPLALWRGVGGWSKFDRGCIAISVIALVCLKVLDLPTAGVILCIIADLFAILPTWKKVDESEEESGGEPLLGWNMTLTASFLALGAIESWTLATAAFPIYMVANTAITIAVIVRHRKRC
jgi:hypothetical protein